MLTIKSTNAISLLNRTSFFSIILTLSFFSKPCAGQENTVGKPKLIFNSGFEGTSRIIPLSPANNPSHNDDIIGIDNTFKEKNDWVKDWTNNSSKGIFSLEYTGGDSTKRYAKIVPDPLNQKNNVLQFWLNDSWLADGNYVKARVQADIYGVKEGYKEFYQSVRMFLPDDINALKSYPDVINWLTISEFWNNEWWGKSDFGFRVSLAFGKFVKEESDLYFFVSAENPGQKDVWRYRNKQVKVPVGKWFTMDYYFKEGDSNSGRFYMTIKSDGEPKQLVFDIKGYTHNTNDPNPDGITHYNPMKLYTSKEIVSYMKSKGKTLQVYWDDFKLWENKRPEQDQEISKQEAFAKQ